ncbi:ubiquitin-specific protease otu1 [Naganishia albida]|nr:ubiquitin-specific protease otu1 [Naganishia albida]
MTVAVRLRHPRGVTTLHIEPETTYEELQIMIFSATEIPLDAQELKFGYPPKAFPSTVTSNPHAKLSLIPITKGEQIMVTEHAPSSSRKQFTTGPTSKKDATQSDPLPSGTNVPPPPTPGVFETAPTPKSTTSTATHTPTPAPSVPRTIIPSPYIYNNPGTAGSTASSTPAAGGPGLTVPTKGHIGSSPLAERNQNGVPGGTATRDGYAADAHNQHLGGENALTALAGSGKTTYVNVNDGMGSVLVHRIVPDDNSCLFSAIGLVLKGKYDDVITRELREVAANEIRKDSITYSDVMLGRGREEYIDTIQKPSSWGGAIELSIFAKHFKTEISSYDVLTGRADRFGEGEYDNRCILIYSGIHYDAMTLAPSLDAPADFHTSIFPTSDSNILKAAEQLVKQLKEKHYYTDTQNFDLRCQVCQIGLKGEQGAREHAIKTGHVEFGEY